MNKSLSTYDRLMKDKNFKKEFNTGYKIFLLKEICLLLKDMKNMGNKNE